MRLRQTALSLLLLSNSLAIFPSYADETPLQQPAAYSPWLTGPLIAQPGIVTPVGQFVVQSYLSGGAITGEYSAHWKPISAPNFYNISFLLLAEIGLTKFMDIQLLPEVIHNATQGRSSTHFADLPVLLDFQLFGDEQSTWFPGIKLSIAETFPTGKYQKFNPEKKDSELTGLGSFSTAPILVLYKIYHVAKQHYLSMTASFQYTYYVPVHVKGFNAYGGGFGTRGKVYPGNLSTAILSFEYTLNQNWVLALDNVYIHKDRDRFKGKRGTAADGTPAIAKRPSSEQLSFAPAIEYNFNINLGLIAGVWFSAAGRNSFEFRTGIISFEVSY